MLSRREFVAIPALAAGAALSGLAQGTTVTAGQVVDRIKQNLGVPWREGPTDTFNVQGFVKDAVYVQKLQFIHPGR